MLGQVITPSTTETREKVVVPDSPFAQNILPHLRGSYRLLYRHERMDVPRNLEFFQYVQAFTKLCALDDPDYWQELILEASLSVSLAYNILLAQNQTAQISCVIMGIPFAVAHPEYTSSIVRNKLETLDLLPQAMSPDHIFVQNAFTPIKNRIFWGGLMPYEASQPLRIDASQLRNQAFSTPSPQKVQTGMLIQKSRKTT